MARGRTKGRSIRDRIWEHIHAREQLGAAPPTPASVAAALGISRQALHYHVNLMVAAGILERNAGGHALRTRPRPSDGASGTDPAGDDPPAPMPQSLGDRAVAAALVLLLRLSRWPKPSELADELGLSLAATRRLLTELEAAGRVQRIHGGRAVMVTPPDGGGS